MELTNENKELKAQKRLLVKEIRALRISAKNNNVVPEMGVIHSGIRSSTSHEYGFGFNQPSPPPSPPPSNSPVKKKQELLDPK